MQIDLNGTWELCHGEQNGEAPSKPADLKASGWKWIAASVPGNLDDFIPASQAPAPCG